MKHTTSHPTPALRREGIAMGVSHNSKRLLVAAITIAGLAGGVAAVQADTFQTRVTAPGGQDLSVVAGPAQWPAIPSTTCAVPPVVPTDPCDITLTAGSGTATVKDVVNGDVNGEVDVPFLGFGVNGGDPALAGAPTSTIKVPVGTTLKFTLTQPGISDPIDLTFPSLAAGKVTHVGNDYTVHADTVGTSVFQPGTNDQAPVQVAMGLVGVLIVTPTDGGGVDCAACGYDGLTPYADEAIVATTDLDYEFATAIAASAPFDMSYFGQPKHADDTPRQVYHVINGKAFPDTDVIDARAGDRVLLRYVNAGVTDKSMGLLGLRQTLLARNASKYPEQQSLVAPLVGPGETADVEVVIPGDAIAGQKYSLMDQGRQMNHGTDSGYGGALTFLNVWTGSAPTVSALAYDPTTHTVTATGTPSAANILAGFQTLVTDTAMAPLEADWPAIVDPFAPALIADALGQISKVLVPAPAMGKFVWVRVQQGAAFSAPISVVVGASPPTVSNVAFSVANVTADAASNPGLTITGFQTFVNLGAQPVASDWPTTIVPIGSPAATVSISGLVVGSNGDTIWVRVQDSLGTWSAPGSVVVSILPPPPPPVYVAPTVSAVNYVAGDVTATGDSDVALTITGYQTAITDLITDSPSWSPTVSVVAPLSSVSITETLSVAANPGQFVWVRVLDSNGTWSTPGNFGV